MLLWSGHAQAQKSGTKVVTYRWDEDRLGMGNCLYLFHYLSSQRRTQTLVNFET